MWSHCIVCSDDLGANKDLEYLSVGSRVAFDPEKGRLWVICLACERWNLVPIRKRWEAVEELQGLWDETTLRTSTKSIGLARLRSGLEIIRVSPDAVELELAWWRWGQGGRSWFRRAVPWIAAGAVAAGAATVPVVGVPGLLILGAAGARIGIEAIRVSRSIKVAADGRLLTVSKRDLENAGMDPADDELGWSIHLNRLFPMPPDPETGATRLRGFEWVEFKGQAAVRFARRAFPALNRRKPKVATLEKALDRIRDYGGPEKYIRRAAAKKPRWVKFKDYPESMRLALEIALFQESEKEAAEGHLGVLEEAWREAEELAAISDGLLAPDWSVGENRTSDDPLDGNS